MNMIEVIKADLYSKRHRETRLHLSLQKVNIRKASRAIQNGKEKDLKIFGIMNT